MKEKGIGNTSIIVIILVVASAAGGIYYAYSAGMILGEEYDKLQPGETLIKENVAGLGLQFEEIKEYYENIETYQARYTGSAEEMASWRHGLSKEELQETEFIEFYKISVRYTETLFNVELEEELSEGSVPEELINKFQKEGYSLPDNAIIGKSEKDWVIGVKTNEGADLLYRIQREDNSLDVKETEPSTSIYSELTRFDSVKGADKYYESEYEKIKESWKEMDYDPEAKAVGKYKACVSETQWKEVIENGEFVSGDDSYARYYEAIGYGGAPGFGITFRERNVVAGVFVSGDGSYITKNAVELAKIMEKRLE